MCGINGFSWKDEALIKEMNNAIKHRGPDAENYVLFDNASLGQVRLSIIDLDERANQPLKYEHEGKEYWIVFNGEIYNYKEIKDELKRRGFEFRTTSDTEVLLAAYIFYGKDVVHKLNGMWAFCIYDGKKFFCSRDRIGKKPLYYASSIKHFIFSSELKGLLPWLKERTINKEAVELYFALGFIPSPLSIFEEVYKLPAGSILEWRKGEDARVERFYKLKPYNPSKNKKDILNEIDTTLRHALQLRWERSDVPVGIFLSSGIDSSLIYAMLKDNMPKAFTIKFYDPEYDESSLVQKWTDAEIVKFEKEDFDNFMPYYFTAYDEPFADYSSFAVMKLSKYAASKVKVVLSGDGGDEVFGGYEVYRAYKISRLFKKCKCAHVLGKILQRKCKELSTCWKIGEILRLSKYSVKEWWKEWLKNLKYYPQPYKRWVDQHMNRAYEGENIQSLMNFDIYARTLADNYLTKVDRASMLYGIEVRSPFLDYRMLNLSKKIKDSWKVGYFQGKKILRQYAAKYLPSFILKNKKRGFTPPLKELFKDKDHDLNLMLDELSTKNIISSELTSFYKEKVFNKNHEIALVYKMRLWIFYEWWKRYAKT